MARLHSCGIFLIDMELLNNTDSGNAICAASFFSKLGGGPSGPQDVLAFSLRSTRITLSVVKIISLNSAFIGATLSKGGKCPLSLELLLQRLEHGFGLADVVLRWIHSFLSDRTSASPVICILGSTHRC